MTYSNKTVGKRIEVARTNEGLSRKELGKAVGRSRDQIQKYEEGESDIPLPIAVSIADVLHLSLEQLICRADYVVGSQR